jgi:hypothetical protein
VIKRRSKPKGRSENSSQILDAEDNREFPPHSRCIAPFIVSTWYFAQRYARARRNERILVLANGTEDSIRCGLNFGLPLG